MPGCTTTKPQENRNGLVKRCGAQYKISWTEGVPTHYLQDDTYFYVPISSVSCEDYDGTVYNIETEDHTYAVPFVVHNCAMAYPGAPLHDTAIARGTPLPEDTVGWAGYSQHAYECLPLGTKHLTPAEVVRFRDDAFQAYFTGKRYQSKVYEKFGPAALNHVRNMATYKLPRQILGDPRR